MKQKTLAEKNIGAVGDFLGEGDTGKPFLLGLSGGIDSTTLGYLVSQKFGKERLETFTIVEGWLDKDATNHAIEMGNQLSNKHTVIPIKEIYSNKLLKKADPENYAILLGQAITFVNNMHIPTHQSLISANLQETAVELGNFGTYQGEISPTAHFFKSEIYYMADELEVPKEAIERVPGSGILDTMTDEELIGVPYQKLEKYLMNVRVKDNGSKAFSLEYLTSDREGVKELCGITQKQLEHLEFRLLHSSRFWIKEGPRPKRYEEEVSVSKIDRNPYDSKKEIDYSPLFRPESYTISPGEKTIDVLAVNSDAKSKESGLARKLHKPKEIVMIGPDEKVNFVEHCGEGIKVITVHHGGFVRYGC